MAVTKPQNATLIDSISEGYAAINRRPWLVLVPIVLNLYLWFGAPISLAPLLNTLQSAIKGIQPGLVDQGQMQTFYDQLASYGAYDVRPQLMTLNFVPTMQPYALGSGSVGRLIDAGRTDTIQLSTIGGALLAFLALNAFTLVISALFVAHVGAAVRGQSLPGGGLRQALNIGLTLLGSLAVLLAVAVVLGLPLLFLATILLYINQTLGVIILELLMVVVFWVNIYIGFYPEAIVISGQGPLRAIYTSANLVRRNFWGTLGFLGLSLLITLGSGVIWQQLIGSTVGMIIAIIASAYLGSGLLAARMAFFRERLRRWQSIPAVKRPANGNMMR